MSRPPDLTLVDQFVTALTSGTSVLVIGTDGGAAPFAAAAPILARARTRVLRAGPPLDLPAFMAQVTPVGPAPGDAELERGFKALVALDPACDRIALLVEEAHLLPKATLQYIELALRAGPHLQLAFAGRPEIADTLAYGALIGLGQRRVLRLELPAPLPAPAARPPISMAMPLRSNRARYVGALACLGITGGLVMIVLTAHAPTAPNVTIAVVDLQPAAASPAKPAEAIVAPMLLKPSPEPAPKPQDAAPAASAPAQSAALSLEPSLAFPPLETAMPDAAPAPRLEAAAPAPDPEPMPAAVPFAGVPARVVLRYSRDSAAARMRAANLAETLRAQGFGVADPTAAPAAASSVTFFYAEDRSSAERVASDLAVPRPVQRRVPVTEAQPRPGTIEVMVAGS